jgi:glycosyltransferase involved in cell wall biosynthesis
VRRFPRAILLIAGDGNPSYVHGLRRLADELSLTSENIRWLGFARGPLKRWLFKRAGIFVLCSWSENFSIAVAEAMSSAVPVVVGRGVGLARMVAESHSGLVTDNSIADLQAHIEHLLEDPARGRRMGIAGQETVRQRLSLDTYAKHLRGMYESAATRGRISLKAGSLVDGNLA